MQRHPTAATDTAATSTAATSTAATSTATTATAASQVVELKEKLGVAMRRVDTLLPPGAELASSPRRAGSRTRDATGDAGVTAAAPAATTAGGDNDDEEEEEEDDEDMFEEVSATLKPGYEEAFVDPDAGWEKPPPEAMRPPDERQPVAPRAASPPLATVALPPPQRQLTRLAAARGSSGESSVEVPVESQLCGAARRDGSLCLQRVTVGVSCRFHGRLVERDACGIPRHPTGVYAALLSAQRRGAAASAAAEGSPGPYADVDAASPATAESTAATDRPTHAGARQDSKRPRGSVDPLPPYSAAPVAGPERPAKHQTTRQRLLARMNRKNR